MVRYPVHRVETQYLLRFVNVKKCFASIVRGSQIVLGAKKGLSSI
jgi:hypothetical protein